jgi:hypothetical protein
MFTIKRSQLDQLQAIIDKQLEDTVFEHIKSNHQQMIKGLPDFIIREMVQVGIAKAKRYQLCSDYAVGIFVALMVEVSPNFDQYWKVQEVLNLDIEDNKKIKLIYRGMNELDWQIAEELYNENAWYE